MDIKHIQWFPGHMTKAMRMMEDNIKLVDGVIFVLDARAPFSCINDALEKKLGNKPFLYVVNKSDLIPESDRDFVVKNLRTAGEKSSRRSERRPAVAKIFIPRSEACSPKRSKETRRKG